MTPETLTLTHAGLAFTAHAAGAGPVVLMLHGFPDTPATFAHQLGALAEAGYRPVAVTMRGYEPSSQPEDGDYHAVRMAEDVTAFAAALSDGPVHLVGHDWGANIAYAAASLAPERFASLTTIAVPHPVRFGEAFAANAEQQARSAYILAFQTPGFEEQIIADDCAYLEALWRAWSPGWDIPAQLLAAMKATFRQPGVARAALEYYRQAFDAVSPAAQETAALLTRPITVPTLGICGAEDQCITQDVFLGAMRESDFPGGLETRSIPGAGHFCHAEAPEAVNAALLDWFARHPA
ncbi:alpha/beta fold hydrolase [Erythrobacter oryzae]|uniref:alpha/beta fold hydrolase n=1 Tax=Erythrobacter oryzae TaxID=3019556 RepID=UPI0025570BFA|nr:alpha/beta hydrolase [Erythrobacter sp. COR-2]